MSLLDNPLIQSTLIPVMIVVLSALGLTRLRRSWLGLSALLSFYISALLISGVQFLPLTSVRKILLIGLILCAVLLAIKNIQSRKHYYIIIISLVIAATVWVLWPLISQQAWQYKWPLLIAVVFAAGQTWLLLMLQDKGTRAHILIVMLSLATSVIAVLGASAMVGQLAAVITAVVATLLGLYLLRLIEMPRLDFFLPLAIMAVLLVISANAYARVPLASMLCLLIMPALMFVAPARIQSYINGRPWVQLLYYLLILLPVAALAIYLAQSVDEEMLYY